MGTTIQIYRGATLIADGAMAKLNGFPLAQCEHALDVFALCEHALDVFPLLRAVQVDVLDYGSKQNSVTLEISREFSSGARAMDHATRAAQVGTGQFNLVIIVTEDGVVHTWTLSDRTATGAAWKTAKAAKCSGIRADMTYTITGGRWTYTGPLAGTYSDEIAGTPPDYVLSDTGPLGARRP